VNTADGWSIYLTTWSWQLWTLDVN